MADLRVEPGSATLLPPCACCGGQTRIVRGYVFADGARRAFYVVRWSPGRPQHDAEVAVSIGHWDGEGDADRSFVAMRHRILDNGPAFMVVDAAKTSWTDPILGRPLSRAEALASLAREAFGIVDAVGAVDERVAKWLLE